MRTISLEPWQIVGLTLLTLILAVILSRVAILIVLVLSRRWYAQNRNQLEAKDVTTQQDYRHSSASGEWRAESPDFVVRQEHSEGERSTGLTPGGVGFIMTPHAGGVPVTKRQIGFQSRRKKGSK